MAENRSELEQRMEVVETQLARLDERFETLSEQHHSLRDRLLTLSIATQPHPRFPFFTWYITRNMSDEIREQLQFLLGRLSNRLDGDAPIPEFANKSIAGIPDHVLHGTNPPSIEEITTAVKWVTGMNHDSQVTELFQALHGQGMFRSLGRYYLGGEPDVEVQSNVGLDLEPDTGTAFGTDTDTDTGSDAEEDTQVPWRHAYAEVKRELATLREAIRCLAIGKQTRPEFAFDAWLVANDVFDDRRIHLELVLGALEERLSGRPFTVRRSVPGIADEWLYRHEPPTPEEARDLLMLALDTRNAATIDELFLALAARGDRPGLVAWWIRPAGAPGG